MTILKCKECKAEVTQEDLDYVENHEIYPSELEHEQDCKCITYYNDGLDMDVCNCEFVEDKLNEGEKNE